MGIVITLGLQKGGVSKTTTTGILAYLMAREGKKVLVVDMDMQGNVSEMLSGVEANEFIGASVYEAIVHKDLGNKIRIIDEKLHLLPANNFLSLLSRWLYTGKYTDFSHEKRVVQTKRPTGSPFAHLDTVLSKVRDHYDYILIDTPPALSEQTTNALYASDYVITMYESSKFCHSAIENFFLTIDMARQTSPWNVEMVGILRTLNDVRRGDSKYFNEKIREEYPNAVFKTIITRKAKVGRIPIYGFMENKELNEAVKPFEDFYEELKTRVVQKETVGV